MAVMPSVLSPECDDELAQLVDFKWLIAPHGFWIDLPRIVHDRLYARQCLDSARLTPSELVRRTAERVLPRLC